MLSEKMKNQLNHQIGLEFFSANLYLQMSAWCVAQGLEGCAAFLRDHAVEERDHMERLFDYVNECGSMALIGAIDAPETEFGDVWKVFEQTYKHEQFITQKINALVDVAVTEKDWSTFNFLQWYVAEQHEEENLFKGIIDKARLVGDGGTSLYHFDAEMAKLAASRGSSSK